MYSRILVICALLALSFTASEAKVYGQCELANTLRSKGVPEDQVATWVCIAHAESNFNTQAINSNTWDYGIFQISSIYWCQSGDSAGNGCGISCNSLLGDDITEDIACVRYIYAMTESYGQIPGFKAWTTYAGNCAGDNSGWISGC
ncbi:lysozyme C-1-like [Anthonomus grandis grandis]|uniref:lysozyme C-1-like n=1 Tax=Anthonomus grandis grandis TaxID=2921223 RepID=UPI0021659913|nr:lysozyme C-1-like [Anthonomus grandis grandis]